MAAACAMLLGTFLLVLLVVDSGVVLGLLRGGRLHGLRTARLKAPPLLAAALVLQLLLGLPGHPLPGGRWGIGAVLLIVSLLLLGVVVRANAQLPGMQLLALGLLANLVVVGLNGGSRCRPGHQRRRPRASSAPRQASSVLSTWSRDPRPTCRSSAPGSGFSVSRAPSVSAVNSARFLGQLWCLVDHVAVAG
jgi:hypothetical protein